MPEILSEKNPLLKEVRRAASRGELTEDGFAVAEGFHLLDEAVRSKVEIGAVILSETARRDVSTSARLVVVPEQVFRKLSSTETPQGVIALIRPPRWQVEDVLRATPLLVVLDGIQDPGNAGAIIRAAEAFGATGAVFLKGSVNPYNPKCLRASAGSVFRLPIVALEPDGLPDKLRYYAAESRAAVCATSADFTIGCAIVVGSEGAGVSAELLARSTRIRIPTEGVESLNAAIAAGILLYEARRQRSLA